MSSREEEAERYRAERLAARAANYRSQVARLRALIGGDPSEDHNESEES